MLKDNSRHYGTVSRALHWGMAILFAWQFGGMLMKFVLGRVPLMSFWVGTHASVGMLLLLLCMARALWAFVERRRRPPYQGGLVGQLARLGHVGLYGLMFIVPALALLRQFGSGRGVQFFGLQLQAATGEKVGWMVAPGSILHGKLAWLLLALIAGHIAMVMVHRYFWRDDVLARMAGRRR